MFAANAEDAAKDRVPLQQEETTSGPEVCASAMDVDGGQPQDEPSESELAETVYQCPVENCDAEFISYRNLERHMHKGVHRKVAAHENLYDYAMQLFGKNLEGICPIKYPEVMEEAIRDLQISPHSCDTDSESQGESNEGMGWALKKKIERRPLGSECTAYLLEKYNEGEKSRKKFTGHEVAEQMRKEKINGNPRFLPRDWLKWTSIDSFFSRETQRRRKQQLQQELTQPVGYSPYPTQSYQETTPSLPEQDVCPVTEQLDPNLEVSADPDLDYLYDDTLPQPDDVVREAFETEFVKSILID